MRIALFSRYPRTYDTPRGGVESVTVILSQELARQPGNDVHVVVLEKGLRSETVEQDRNVHIHRVPGSGWPQILDIHCGPGRSSLIRKVRQLKPDIVHSHETFGLTALPGDFGAPHLFTVHGFDHANIPAERRPLSSLRAALWARVERRGLRLQRHIVSISPYVRKMIEPHTGAQIYDIDNPVEEALFECEPAGDQGRVLCVGWLNERKNTVGSVESFAAAAKKCGRGTLVIAGQARDRAYLEDVRGRIERHRIGDRVEILGHIGRGRLLEELRRASLLLLPSLQENAPMVVAEAMAVGIPVVTSNLCGMPYMVEDGGSGYLVNPRETGDIAERLQHLLCDGETRVRMGARAKEIARSRFHPARVAGKTQQAYQSTIGASPRF